MWSTDQLIAAALEEDIGPGDVTTQFFVAAQATAQARIFAKQSGVLAGVATAAAVFEAVDPSLQISVTRNDGERLEAGGTVLEISGSTRSILTAERTALNFVQRLSGIATLTRQFVDAVAGTRARILDTRKTTPGWRHLEKAAVRAGGGQNHRAGLYDMVMVKDNHLLAESRPAELQRIIDRIRAQHPGIRIELEADSLEQIRAFLEFRGVDIILLDNMSLDQMSEAVRLVRSAGSGIELEASGGVSLETVRAIAETGVDFISSGALTHSALALDFSLELKPG
ncbi:MAG: carboxylating nicotinate-nucleotide diphosphorylase [Verrucomicrobiales bacterium]